jgi:mannosyltransferase
VDTDTFFPDAKPTDVGLQNTVLFVGGRSGYKRFDLAVDAMRSLARQFILGIVGPPLGPEERAQLDSAVPGRWIHFGTVSSSRLREIYSSVYSLIFPSDCEGFGLTVLEAMSCGCPAVVANRGSLPEVGGTAVLYAEEQRSDCYSEALIRLEDGRLRKKLIAEGASRAAQFSWAETGRRTQALYTSSL